MVIHRRDRQMRFFVRSRGLGRSSIVSLTTSFLFVLSGCATMYDPLPRIPVDSSQVLVKCRAGVTYADGIDCARMVQQAYINAMVDGVVLSDSFAVALIPMGAAAIGLGAFGAGRDPVTGVALATATIYGIGTWLTSKARRDVFGVGAEAVGCVIRVSVPLGIDDAKRQTIRNRRDVLDQELQNLDQAIGQLDSFFFGGSPTGEVEALLGKAKSVRNEAVATIIHADEVLQSLNQAGTNIVTAVNDVRIAVTKAAVATAPDLR